MGSEQLSTLTDRTVVSRVIRLAIGMAAARAGRQRGPAGPAPAAAGGYDLSRYGGGAQPILDLFIG